jgi:hypothetical protein
MPKLKNVTDAELTAALDSLDEPLQVMHDLSDRIEKGYCDEIAEPVRMVRTLLAANRATANLAAMVLFKLSLQEQRRETERLIRQRDGQQQGA